MLWADARDWLTEAATTTGLTSAFFLVLFVHIWISLGTGRFGPARTTTWLILIVGGSVVQASTFLGYVLPWGQTAYWLATVPHPAWLEGVVARWPADGVSAAAIAVLAADMAVAYFGLWRSRRAAAVVWPVVVIAVLAVVIDAAVTSLTPPPAATADLLLTPAHLLPDWYARPIYAVLRCVPAKLAGVMLSVAVCIVPAVWPWARPPRRAVLWWAAWIALATVWVGLGAAGSSPQGAYPVAAIRGLVALYFAYFLLPLLLRRGVRAETSG